MDIFKGDIAMHIPSDYVDLQKNKLTEFAEACKDFKEIITRNDLLNVGIDPGQYLNDEKNEIFISDIVSAAKTNIDNYENPFNKELFNTCKILDAYNKKNNEIKALEKNYKANG